MASEGVDAVRSAGVGLDGFVHRWVNRVLRRSSIPSGPPGLGSRALLVAARGRAAEHVAASGGRLREPLRVEPERDVGLQGSYAGFVTRFGGFLIDIVTIAVLFALAGHVIDYLVSALRGPSFSFTRTRRAPRGTGR